MKAIKENKVYAVADETDVKAYKARGFDIYDDNGKLKESGIGKAVTFEKYEALQKECEKLRKEVTKLKKKEEKSKEDEK